MNFVSLFYHAVFLVRVVYTHEQLSTNIQVIYREIFFFEKEIYKGTYECDNHYDEFKNSPARAPRGLLPHRLYTDLAQSNIQNIYEISLIVLRFVL